MGDKSAQKKKFIVETARQVFKKKGFKEVTMKDIVEACDISRGGLYLYFKIPKKFLRRCLSWSRRTQMMCSKQAFQKKQLLQMFWLYF